MNTDIVFTKINPEVKNLLMDLFCEIKDDSLMFHPHGFENEDAVRISNYVGKDFYIIAILDGKAIAYGLLRGWDDGYEIPILGCYLHKDVRGTGFSKFFMNYLHFCAKQKGAMKIMLKVYKLNIGAIKLYKSMGYVLENFDDKQYVGYIDLKGEK